ncbi:carbamoyltransferase HypF [Leeia sp. TBRC 13508]|uniref:Carbamoyltransferase HypF n=1 Tax=Leeia speluncae TaxID=2884804 RepID=A0ABS8D403_9NEIS|nr:carbamoyltransferase HypF [Leeia speluncae]MCB6182388.1 carbamoyltransferase HypF [Leeia speluncae]
MSQPLAIGERWLVSGRVQGVGFRPFVWQLAKTHQLIGWVRNTPSGVEICWQGSAESFDSLAADFYRQLPPLAHVHTLVREVSPLQACADFQILPSLQGEVKTSIPADLGICDACLNELFDPEDPRNGYPLINCTHCGPRYSICHALPYDRQQTSMATFPMCSRCEAEYHAPDNRRFHAEPTACPACGPRLQWRRIGAGLVNDSPLTAAIHALQAGEWIAVKGLGGFHLVGDAKQPAVVATIRDKKRRATKPLAVMMMNLDSVKAWCEVTPAEAMWLTRPERPIVLLKKKPIADTALSGIAPNMDRIGVMLPYTPLQWLMFHEALGKPVGQHWREVANDLVWIMTSANHAGSPILTSAEAVEEKLDHLVGGILDHDRPIIHPCDDSVLSVVDDQPVWLRRARGLAPEPIYLRSTGADVLALGGLLKNTITVCKEDQAFVSPHLGDLQHPAVAERLLETVDSLLAFTHAKPAVISCDAQPDYIGYRLAEQLAEKWQIPLTPVQHHHAHIGAVLAEKGVEEPVLGLVLDGFGWGEDGTAWGGELLLVDGKTANRLGHISEIALPGGDLAAKLPWRMAVALGQQIQRALPAEVANQTGVQVVKQQLALGLNAPTTSSMGRWFDAIAGWQGICSEQIFEGEAPMRLAALLGEFPPPSVISDIPPFAPVLDLLPLAKAALAASDDTEVARQWHVGLVQQLAGWVLSAAQQTALKTVVLAGGVFANAYLLAGLKQQLLQHGINVLVAEQMPVGDGGISLGQAWIARKHLQQHEQHTK